MGTWLVFHREHLGTYCVVTGCGYSTGKCRSQGSTAGAAHLRRLLQGEVPGEGSRAAFMLLPKLSPFTVSFAKGSEDED